MLIVLNVWLVACPNYVHGHLHTKRLFRRIDVLEEYTRPARYVENGHIVTKPALASDPEMVEFDKIGTLESFNTDGLQEHIVHHRNTSLT